MTRIIWCAGCQKNTKARLTGGKEIYPHRKDLYPLPFWICDKCGNYVGCHHKTKEPTRPLGIIPTAELRKARGEIHAVLDPIWRHGKINRKKLYRMLAEALGVKEYHTAEIRTVDEAKMVLGAVKTLKSDIYNRYGT